MASLPFAPEKKKKKKGGRQNKKSIRHGERPKARKGDRQAYLYSWEMRSFMMFFFFSPSFIDTNKYKQKILNNTLFVIIYEINRC